MSEPDRKKRLNRLQWLMQLEWNRIERLERRRTRPEKIDEHRAEYAAMEAVESELLALGRVPKQGETA